MKGPHASRASSALERLAHGAFAIALCFATFVVAGCGARSPRDDRSHGDIENNAPKPATPESPPPIPPGAQTSFFSADLPFYRDVAGPGEEEEDEEDEPIEYEQGDLYRMLDGGTLVALNQWGLAVIDVHDLTAPKVVGRWTIGFHENYDDDTRPVGLWVRGNRVLVLMNGREDDELGPAPLQTQSRTGGLGVLFDLSDHAAPRVLSRVWIPGTIQTSQLVSGPSGDWLYVGSLFAGPVTTPLGVQVERQVMLASYALSGDSLTAGATRTFVNGMRARAQDGAILVASSTCCTSGGQVTIVDISAHDGSFGATSSAPVPGTFEWPTPMELRNGVVRVFSETLAYPTPGSHLSTFSWSATDGLRPIDDEMVVDFYAVDAVFVDDGVFGTGGYTPNFHAFAIDPTGKITDKSGFKVSQPDILRSALHDTRLITIGYDYATKGGTIGLYDVTNLHVDVPLVAQAKAPSWDEPEVYGDQTVTTFDDAVDVAAPTGEREHGLLLLTHPGGVQIFTYSASTITPRGDMPVAEWVVRSFRIDDTHGVNLSNATLGIADESDLNAPKPVSSLEVMPRFESVFAFGGYRVRVVDSTLDGKVHGEVIPRDGRADLVDALARFDLPLRGRRLQVGNLLVSFDADFPSKQTTFSIVDLTSPLTPRVLPSFSADGLPMTLIPDVVGYDPVIVTQNAITFVDRESGAPVVGPNHAIHGCTTWPVYPSCHLSGLPDPSMTSPLPDCSFWDGRRTCIRIDDKPEYCAGGLAYCTRSGGSTTCTLPRKDPTNRLTTTTYCGDWQASETLQPTSLVVVDLSNPAAPKVSPRISLPVDEAVVRAVGAERDVFVTSKQPAPWGPGQRPVKQYFVRRVDLSVPSTPVLGDKVNVPGVVIDVAGDTLVTRDDRWGEQFVETAVARAVLSGDTAFLVADHVFGDRWVENVAVDDHRYAVVDSQLVWPLGHSEDTLVHDRTLSIVGWTDDPSGDATSRAHVLFSGPLSIRETSVPFGVSPLAFATHDLAFFGMGENLVVDLADPNHPHMRGSFPVAAAPPAAPPLFDNGEMLAACGAYGIAQMPLAPPSSP